MRTALFWFLLTVGCSTFAVGQQAHYGAQESQQKAKTSERQTGQRQISGASHPRNGSVLPNVNHPLSLPRTETRHAIPNTTQARSAQALQSTNTAATTLRENHATSNLHFHTAPRPAQSFNNVRHHKPNPAILGGSAKPIAANTGALNGTHMRRRP